MQNQVLFDTPMTVNIEFNVVFSCDIILIFKKKVPLLEIDLLISVNFLGMTRDDLFNANTSIFQTLAEACVK